MRKSTTTFGNLLQQLRSAAALSQEELAEQSGLSRSSISNLERGLHPTPRLETVRMLAHGLRLGDDDRSLLLASARPALWHEQGTLTETRISRRLTQAPAPLTRLIGRESEVMALRVLLRDTAVRLVTVTGPGGVGKTRLAIDVAEGLADDYPDGVVFIDLTALDDHELVVPAVAAALGVRETSGQRLDETLSQCLTEKRLLLLFDNCERTLLAAPSLTGLLSACPRLTIFATSRQPFRVRGEREVPLLPLPLPSLNRQETLAAVAANPAVALFTERAVAADPAFALCADNADVIAAICRCLDGLPLAIELAAARIKVLTPAALAARLERRLPMLTGGGADLPTRQRSMRETIAWSIDLLSADEQALFRRLAVFVGGFTLEAAEVMAGRGGQRSGFDGVTALVDKSLLRRIPGPDNEPRLLMLETLREFGLEQLHAFGETETARQDHAAYFVDFAQRSYLYHLATQDSVNRRYLRIEADHANIVLALTTLAGAHDAHGVARLAGALGLFWQLRGYLREGCVWLEWALAHGSDMPLVLRCRVLASLASLQWAQGRNSAAAATARDSLLLAEQNGITDMIAYSVHVLGLVAASQQQWPESEALFTRALKLWRELGVRAEEAIATQMLSKAAYGLGHHELSAERAEAALSMSSDLDHAFGAAAALDQLGRLARDEGDMQRAASAYQEALRLYASIGNRWAIRNALAGLAEIAALQGQYEVAARLVGVIDGLTQDVGSFISDATRENCNRAAALSRPMLGEHQFAAMCAAGRTLQLEDAVVMATAIPSLTGALPPTHGVTTIVALTHTAR